MITILWGAESHPQQTRLDTVGMEVNMIEITQKFHGANACIWRNIKQYYNRDMEIVSEKDFNNGDEHSGYLEVVVKVKSKADWENKMSAANR